MKAGDIGWDVSWETLNPEDDTLEMHDRDFATEAEAFKFAEKVIGSSHFGVASIDRYTVTVLNPGEFPTLLGREYDQPTRWLDRGDL